MNRLALNLESEYKRSDGRASYEADQRKVGIDLLYFEAKLANLNKQDDVEAELIDIYERVVEELESLKKVSYNAAQDAGILSLGE